MSHSSPLLQCRYEVWAPWADEASTWPSRTSAPASPSLLCACTTNAAWVWTVTWRCSPMSWRAPTHPLWWRSGVSVWITQRKGTHPRCTAALRGSGWCPSGGVCARPDSKNTETPAWVSCLRVLGSVCWGLCEHCCRPKKPTKTSHFWCGLFDVGMQRPITGLGDSRCDFSLNWKKLLIQ